MKSDSRWMESAYLMARSSKDPSTQNGAVLIRKNRMVGWGYNGFPFGVDTDGRWESPTKYDYVEHAERSSLFCAARKGNATDGCTMYCPWAPCAECARAIIMSGVTSLVTHDLPEHRVMDDRWGSSIEIGLTMLKEAGVVHRVIGGTFGLTIRFNREEVRA